MIQLATICYIDNGKEWLLLHRNKKANDVHQGKWIGVGGKFEDSETPEECARREIQEETGLIVQKMQLCGIITFPNFTPQKDWYTYVFRVSEFTGELVKECKEGTLEWVLYEDILQKPTWQGDYLFMKWILEKRAFFSAKFVYQDGKLIENNVTFYDNM
ncbi:MULTISPECIES: 8-oxo-dGTP diphosphatase [unclassified Granulicatella]|uniref:NUDIX hydrolase n=1 Tax=unclassified Granulicatella TaxID=2630493 RepID=UPI0010749CD3|nr:MULTISPECIES: 8-oxo-dGTP diphosphatase [unclassified Granulicatella]MBF0779622.1 8-oxo-dGTP diphosphatase [Granulicatella sp. 19428wC4_WM01]TFU96421.1 8-oxo-dGTP diphosphatase [Granulicatella sp. WM01]